MLKNKIGFVVRSIPFPMRSLVTPLTIRVSEDRDLLILSSQRVHLLYNIISSILCTTFWDIIHIKLPTTI
jgi:hypothetical protein